MTDTRHNYIVLDNLSLDILKKYNINISSEDLIKIQTLIDNSDNNKFSKKNPNHKLNYTIIKIDENNIFLLGEGKSQGNKNAFFGEGTFGRVKGVIKLKSDKEGNLRIINDEKYVVKISRFPLISEIKILKEIFNSKVVHAITIPNEKSYIFMPLVEGTKLNDLDYKRMTESRLKNLILLTYKAIYELHERGFGHNDIKLDNILFDKNTVNLIDFGSSSKCDDEFSFDKKGFILTVQSLLKKYISNHLQNDQPSSITALRDEEQDKVISGIIDNIDAKIIDVIFNKTNENDFNEAYENLYNYLGSLNIQSSITAISQILSSPVIAPKLK